MGVYSVDLLRFSTHLLSNEIILNIHRTTCSSMQQRPRIPNVLSLEGSNSQMCGSCTQWHSCLHLKQTPHLSLPLLLICGLQTQAEVIQMTSTGNIVCVCVRVHTQVSPQYWYICSDCSTIQLYSLQPFYTQIFTHFFRGLWALPWQITTSADGFLFLVACNCMTDLCRQASPKQLALCHKC